MMYNNNSLKNKKNATTYKTFFLIIAILLVVVVSLGILAGCKPKDDGDKTEVDNRIIAFGNAFVEAVGEITTEGGTIEIDNTDSALNGMKLIVPELAYNAPINFTISSYAISAHKLGAEFNPITPVIEINNGHEFSREIMKLEIPLSATNTFPMGFYYDEITGSVEAIPTLQLDDDKITLGVKHFSKIVVSDISLSVFQNLSNISGSDYDSGFTPQLDDWQYTNYGSAIAGGGHCGGQSLTMAWYYTQKHIAEGAPRLYGNFDNNDDTDTPGLWQDDNNAYRFSSVVQANANWSSQYWIDFINFSVANPDKTFQAFAYSIRQTSSPQFMAIFPDSPVTGHAIVAYKVEGNKIYVADPNYPGQTDRYVEYNPATQTFLPYSSGANAADISQNGATAYTKIVYAAKGALIDYRYIEEQYNNMVDGTIGDSEFPQTNIEIMTKYDTDQLLWEFEKCKREIKLGSSFKSSLPLDEERTIIKVTPLASNLVYSLYLEDNILPVQNPTIVNINNSLGFLVDWITGVNEYGILVEQYNDGYYDYVDFIRVRIIIQDSNPITTIIFDAAGGTEKVPVTQEAGSVLTAPTDPTKLGYDFGGWYSDYTHFNQYVFATMPYEDIALYAKWIDAELQEDIEGTYYLYTIDGRTDWGVVEYQYYDINSNGTYSEVFKAIADSNTINDSGTWSLSGDVVTFGNNNGTYQVIADGEYLKDLPGESPYFVYKRHTPLDITVSVSFDSRGGTPVNPITGKPGTSLAAPTAPTRDGYRFGGWYKSTDFSILYSFGSMPNRNITVYAKWIEASASQNVKLIYAFHSNYSYNPSIYEFEYYPGEAFPYAHLDYWTFIPSGYFFLGYFTDSACTAPLTYDVVPDHDVYIYIKLQLMTENDMLGRYYKNEEKLFSYLDYHYIEFLSGGVFKVGYKRNDPDLIVVSEGTWTSRTVNGIIVFDVDPPSTSFNFTASFYEDSVSCPNYGSGGTWYKEPFIRE
ncbi:MAG: hypothetical protein EOM87_00840 [Clostridia bacterium]|nr:hypothetical protein [Clostridia bacterium]